MSDERRSEILSVIDNRGEVSLAELCGLFSGVSEMTVRRDLIQLEQDGHIIRTRGGAVSIRRLGDSRLLPGQNGEENEYMLRAATNRDAKDVIARKALGFVEKGRSIYFDAGSTVMALARIVPDETMTIITNGVNVAQELVSRHNVTVMMPGGTVNRNTLSVSGPISVNFVDNLNIELAFMSASGCSADAGFTVSNIYEAELKHTVIARARTRIMLLDSSKFNKSLLFTLAELGQINYLVCECEPPEDLAAACRASGVEIV
ncbi:MAG: DeoR/GlpR transcriptional regulator [Clostridia bacterium]|nr:DeoR/GlpR transcriptional regulator [Clostridia bacterium]